MRPNVRRGRGQIARSLKLNGKAVNVHLLHKGFRFVADDSESDQRAAACRREATGRSQPRHRPRHPPAEWAGGLNRQCSNRPYSADTGAGPATGTWRPAGARWGSPHIPVVGPRSIT